MARRVPSAARQSPKLSREALLAALADRDRELAEARARQSATAEILRVVSRSPADAQPVFESVVMAAVRLLGCDLAFILLCDGATFWTAALGSPEGLLPATSLGVSPIDPSANFPSRAILAKEMLYLPDWSLVDQPAHERKVHELYGVNCSLYLPLLRAGECIGLLTLVGTRPGLFGPGEIAQAESFRDQALIAIENARAFHETKEALERQTATAEILKVIARSPSDTRPVFDAIAASSKRLLRGHSATVQRYIDGMIHLAAFTPTDPVADAAIAANFPRPLANNPAFEAQRDGRVFQVADIEVNDPLGLREIARRRGWRSFVTVPLSSRGTNIGSIAVARPEPGAFGEDEVQLLQTFADQAVIAIENARQFNETQEALEQQKASADVLGVIGKSVSDAAPVFEAILGACQRLFGSDEIGIYTVGDDEMVRVAAWRGPRGEEVRGDVTPLADSVTGRIIRERRTHHIPDLLADPDLSQTVRERATRLGSASLLYAPMLWEKSGLGSILVVRSPPKPFSDREQALLQSFADQAAIAIQNARLFRETQEALQQQTATADVLKVISRSAFDLDAVLVTLIGSAISLCEATRGVIWLRKDKQLRLAAHVNYPEEWVKAASELAITPAANATTASGIAAFTGEVVNIDDMLADPRFQPRPEHRLGDYRGVLAVPMDRDGSVVGVIALSRPEPRRFTDRQVALVKAFADQAVIAIENVRLFDEVQARTRDLSESLQQQTATAEVLKAISRSVFDLDTVLQTLIDTAVRLTRGSRGTIFIRHGDELVASAFHRNVPDSLRAYLAATTWSLDGDSHMARAAREGRVVHIADLSQSYVESDEQTRKRAAFGAGLWAPLMRDGQAIGVFGVPRDEPIAFSDREIELVQTFADQAVIAIENSRLFEQLKARTRDLSEALQQQTATADVLKVISRSAFDLQVVLDTLVQSAQRLCDARGSMIFVRDGEVYRIAAHVGMPEAFVSFRLANPLRADKITAVGRVALTGEMVHLADALADPDIQKAGPQLGDFRAVLSVPLVREDEVVGIFALNRPEPGLFAPGQVKLVQTFADQAAIAIANVRLFNEVKTKTDDLSEALEQQTATADVLKAISRTAFDLDTVLDTLISTAVRLCNANFGQIFRRHGDVYRYAASRMDVDPDYRRHELNAEIKPGRGTLIGRVALENRAVSVEDAWSDPEYEEKDVARLGNVRAMLGVPLMRAGEPIGAFALARSTPIPFTERQIELVTTFADQAVIAIENVRLFDEVQARTRELQESLERQQASAEILRVISASPTDVKPVFEAIALTAGRLFDCQMAAVFRVEGAMLSLVTTATRDRLWAEDELPPSVPIDPSENFPSQAMAEKRTLYVKDFSAAGVSEHERAVSSRFGFSSALYMPLLRGGECVGVFLLTAARTESFIDKDIALAESFRDQAQIAIENTRLFHETQEALQQQTATADVLKVISRSAFGLKTVLQTLVDSAVRLCASDGVIYLRDREVFRAEAAFGANVPGHDPRNRSPRGPGRDSVTGRVALSGRVEQIPDNRADPEFKVVPAQRMNMRALLGVPLLRDGEVEGVFVLGKPEPGLFTDRVVELVRTFADQAVIAIQNVRLFDAVQAKTHDLEESLQLQTATSDVLKVISRSAFDLQAVFDTLTASAVELCGAFSGSICVRDGDAYRYRGNAGPGVSTAMSRYLAEHPATPGLGTIVGRVLLSGKVETIPDVLEDRNYLVPLTPHGVTSRALLGVPLLGKAGLEGALVLTRLEPGQFTDRQIEIVQTFADQAVIAIENVRLFDEVQARTRELAASLDDLRKAQDRLIQSEKLASLGQLTAGIAHEIKNPLNFVNNFSELSRELLDELREVLETASLEKAARGEASELIGMISANLEKVVQHGKRADSIVKNMLLHSREGSGERSNVKVNAMVEEALNLAYHGARAEKPGFNVTIVKSLAPDAGAADLYPQELTRVLLNLISNGFYATTKRRQVEASGAYEPTITASTRDLGDSVEIAIRDNGTGIPDEVKTKMFNPFFTTKPAGEGTGLGLSLSHDIVVKQHGGALEVETEPGAFTQFTIVLPRTVGATTKAGAVS